MCKSKKLGYRRALTIATSDSGGGAGIQADLKTFAALGCYGMSAIAAITAQNTLGVLAIEAISPSVFDMQIRSVLDDIGVDAIKVGMLYAVEHMEVLVEVLDSQNPQVPVVLDPVMVATSGDPLIKQEAVAFLAEHLIPRATLITPNINEAGRLLGRTVHSKSERERAARDLLARGAQAVFVKGGHLDAEDFLCFDDRMVWLSAKKIETHNTHGTGCTLSSAVTAYLAHGDTLETAVQKSKEYVTQALIKGASYTIGQGCGPIHHFHDFWE